MRSLSGFRVGRGTIGRAVVLAAAVAAATAPGFAQEQPWVDPPRVIEPAPPAAPVQPPGPAAQPPATRPPAPPPPAPEPPSAAKPPASPDAGTAAGPPPSDRPADRPAAAPREARPDTKPGPRPREAAPAPAPAPRGPAAAPATPATAMEEEGLALVERYLAAWSAPNEETLAAMPGFYGDRVLFHGRTLSLPALMREKRRFVRRWPLRDYRPRPGTVQVTCQPARRSCRAFALVDFEARGPGGRSSGATTLELVLGYVDGRPAIVTEASRVVARGPLDRAEAGDDDD